MEIATLIVPVISWIAGPFLRCPYCRHWGATLDVDRARWRWRCRLCRHSRRRSSPGADSFGSRDGRRTVDPDEQE